MADKLPDNQRNRFKIIGIGTALLLRLVLLTTISWVMHLDDNWILLGDHSFTGKEIILILGGVFLLYKSIKEIIRFEEAVPGNKISTLNSFTNLLIQVVLIDLVFSVDSILTAIGMTDQVWVMYAAVMISMILMLLVSGPIMNFIKTYPSLKILALSFLIVIAITLISEGLGYSIPKEIIYVSLAFALMVDLLQIKALKR